MGCSGSPVAMQPSNGLNKKTGIGGLQECSLAQPLLEPPVPGEVAEGKRRDQQHNTHRRKVSVPPFQSGHIAEVHPVDPGEERQRHENLLRDVPCRAVGTNDEPGDGFAKWMETRARGPTPFNEAGPGYLEESGHTNSEPPDREVVYPELFSYGQQVWNAFGKIYSLCLIPFFDSGIRLWVDVEVLTQRPEVYMFL